MEEVTTDMAEEAGELELGAELAKVIGCCNLTIKLPSKALPGRAEEWCFLLEWTDEGVVFC